MRGIGAAVPANAFVDDLVDIAFEVGVDAVAEFHKAHAGTGELAGAQIEGAMLNVFGGIVQCPAARGAEVDRQQSHAAHSHSRSGSSRPSYM